MKSTEKALCKDLQEGDAMNIRKLISRVLAVTVIVAMITAPAFNIGVFAAGNGPSIPASSIIIDYDYESVIIDETTLDEDKRDSEIYFIDVYTADVSKWYACKMQDGMARFDISWARSNADVKIYITGDVNNRVTSTVIKWQDTLSVRFTGSLLNTDITDAEKWKQKYSEDAYKDHFDDDTGYFIFSRKINNREETYLDLENIEWRKGNSGNWHDYSELQPAEMEIKGGILEFRIRSESQSAGTAGRRYSSVARYTLTKVVPGPNISVITSDGTINLKNGYEYSLDGEEWTLIPIYATNATTDKATVSAAEKNAAIEAISTSVRTTRFLAQEALGLISSAPITQSKTLYVRTAANQRAAASRISEITIPITGELSDEEFAKITVDYVSSKSGNGGIQIDNANDADFQVAVITPVEATRLKLSNFPAAGATVNSSLFTNLPVTSLQWTTLKGNSYTKIAYSRAVSGSIVIVRKMGTKDELPSPYRICEKSLDYSEALTFASIAGTAKLGYTLTANTSSNLGAKVNSNPGAFTFKWEYANSKNATDWIEIVGVGSSRTLSISDEVPEGSSDPSVYSQTHLKYVRVNITYNGKTVTSAAVGFVN